jgi:hypothetical protein
LLAIHAASWANTVEDVTRTNPESAPAAHRRHATANATLAGLMTWFGDTGLAVARVVPGLLAELDQHVAAIVEALCTGGHQLGPIALAGYARGVRDAAIERGWELPALDQLDWSRADWAVLRLVAVCGLARSAGYA